MLAIHPGLIVAIPSVVSGIGSLFGQSQANKANVREAQKNRDFQADMSSTAWQRGVRDMQAAGLNPALAYSQGGASSPGGATAAAQQDTVGPGIASARAAIEHRKQMRNLDEQLLTQREQTKLTRSQATKSSAEASAQIASNRIKYGGINPSTGRVEPGVEQRNAELAQKLLEFQLPAARNSAQANEKFPEAAISQLLLGSSGGFMTRLLQMLSTGAQRGKTAPTNPRSRVGGG